MPRAHAPPEDEFAREHRWIRLRLIGWVLIGVWQVLSLVSEFVAIDLETRPLRILGKLFGIAGLALVAYGFERLAELAHARALRARDAPPTGRA